MLRSVGRRHGWFKIGDLEWQVGMTRQTVISWRARYEAGGIDALADLPRSGRPPVVDETAVVVATLYPPPAESGVTHWSARLMSDHLRAEGTPVSSKIATSRPLR
jgi:transposase